MHVPEGLLHAALLTCPQSLAATHSPHKTISASYHGSILVLSRVHPFVRACQLVEICATQPGIACPLCYQGIALANAAKPCVPRLNLVAL